ncbi:MAG: hypothetical protein LDLANPLL_02623 [Turneriella sp.]|nr:hypothetical protein [Turneriella sp.]
MLKKIFIISLITSVFYLFLSFYIGVRISTMGIILSLVISTYLYYSFFSIIVRLQTYYRLNRVVAALFFTWILATPSMGLLYFTTYHTLPEVSLVSAMLHEPMFVVSTFYQQIFAFPNFLYLLALVALGILVERILYPSSKPPLGHGDVRPFSLFKNYIFLLLFLIAVASQVRWGIIHDLSELWMRVLYVILLFALITVVYFYIKTQKSFFRGLFRFSLWLPFILVLVLPTGKIRDFQLSADTHTILTLSNALFQSSKSAQFHQEKKIASEIPSFKIQTQFNVLYIVVDSWRAANSFIVKKESSIEDSILHDFFSKSFVFNSTYAPSSSTETAVPSLFTGISSDQESKRIASAPRLWDYFHKANYKTNYIMTAGSKWAKLDVFFKSFGLDTLWSAYENSTSPSKTQEANDDANTVDYFLKFSKETTQPWFSVVYLDGVHYPYIQKPGYIIDDCELTNRNKWPDKLLNCYKNAIRYTSALVAKILQSVDLTKTLVVITADHGEGFNEHGSYFHNQDIYSYAIHVPLVIYLPEKLKTSLSRTDLKTFTLNTTTPVSTLDILPTFLHILEKTSTNFVRPNIKLSGHNLFEANLNRIIFASGCYAEYRCYSRDIAFIDNNYYLIFSPNNKDNTTAFQLYNKEDITQKNQIESEQKNKVIKSLIERAKAIHPFARLADQYLHK